MSVTVTAPSTGFSGNPYTGAVGSVTSPGGQAITDGSVSYIYYSANNFDNPLPGAPNAAGNYDVVAYFSGDSFYSAAASAPAAFTIYPTTASMIGPTTAVLQQVETYTLLVTNVAQADQLAGFEYLINWGDGSATQTVSGLSGMQVTHVFTSLGSDTVTVTAEGLATGITSVTDSQVVQAVSYGLVADQSNPTLMDLVWGGGQGYNSVVFTQTSANTVQISTSIYNGVIANTTSTVTGVTGKVIATGGAGNDTINASGLSTISATLNGAGGNNILYGGTSNETLIGGTDGAEGGSSQPDGSNTIMSGSGNDIIYGNGLTGHKNEVGGNNLIIAGSGNDVICGNYGAGGDGGEGGNNTITSGSGQDTIYGNFGGDGGEGGNNLIVAGGGNDTIYAHSALPVISSTSGTTATGRDVIVGGTGADQIHGFDPTYTPGPNSGDLFIAGTTNLSLTALGMILNEWSSTDSYMTRVADISGQNGTAGLNGSNDLIPNQTVFPVPAIDEIWSNAGTEIDWYVLSVGDDILINNDNGGDQITNLI